MTHSNKKLADLLVSLADNAATCTLVIKRLVKNGRFYFRDGELLDASYDNFAGEVAALEMLSWEDSTIECFMDECVVKEKWINVTLQDLLLKSQNLSSNSSNRQIAVPVAKRESTNNDFWAQLSSQQPAQQQPAFNNETFNTQEDSMNVAKLNLAIDTLKEDLGSALVATDIFTAADGMSIAGYNPQPKASALFNQMTDFMVKSLRDSQFPNLTKFSIYLENNYWVVVIPFGEYRWGILVDLSKTTLGLIVNIVLPKATSIFEQAMKS